MKYSVAENIFEILAEPTMKAWQEVASHYAPFAVSDGSINAETNTATEPLFTARVSTGRVEVEGLPLYFENEPDRNSELKIRIFRYGDGFLFEFIQPRTDIANGWLKVDSAYRNAEIVVDESIDRIEFWKHCASLTSGLMLAYLLATTSRTTLMAHASCILCDDRAYLFIAKSGTGKSTHSRLWLKAVPGSMLLNDDHPIIRLFDDGRVVAYGSPWSGKTHCYVNASAEVGAIVRIVRGEKNEINRLRPSLAYASCLTSFSYMPGVDALAEARHNSIERLVTSVPNYQLRCLPDEAAAILCHDTVKSAE